MSITAFVVTLSVLGVLTLLFNGVLGLVRLYAGFLLGGMFLAALVAVTTHQPMANPLTWPSRFHGLPWPVVVTALILGVYVERQLAQHNVRHARAMVKQSIADTTLRADLSGFGYATLHQSHGTYQLNLSDSPFATAQDRAYGVHSVPMHMSPYAYVTRSRMFTGLGSTDTGFPRRDLSHLLNQPNGNSFDQHRREYGQGTTLN